MAPECWQALGLIGVLALLLLVGAGPSLALLWLAGRSERRSPPD